MVDTLLKIVIYNQLHLSDSNGKRGVHGRSDQTAIFNTSLFLGELRV